jgi:hypothetical protein
MNYLSASRLPAGMVAKINRCYWRMRNLNSLSDSLKAGAIACAGFFIYQPSIRATFLMNFSLQCKLFTKLTTFAKIFFDAP